jgi:RNA polymerase sigma-70 factor, ECF subfamily
MMDAIAIPTSRSPVAREDRLRSAVDAHYDVVWRFLRRMGVSEAAAEDAAQQVLVVFARRLLEVDPDRELSFLLGTALRVASDARKHDARSREVSDEAALEHEPSDAPDVDVELDRRRQRAVLDGVLARLPDELRSVFVMCDLEELTMSEVSSALHVPSGTVASRLRRAREAFAELARDARARHAKESP